MPCYVFFFNCKNQTFSSCLTAFRFIYMDIYFMQPALWSRLEKKSFNVASYHLIHLSKLLKWISLIEYWWWKKCFLDSTEGQPVWIHHLNYILHYYTHATMLLLDLMHSLLLPFDTIRVGKFLGQSWVHENNTSTSIFTSNRNSWRSHISNWQKPHPRLQMCLCVLTQFRFKKKKIRVRKSRL